MKIAVCDNERECALSLTRQISEISPAIQAECLTTMQSLEQMKEEEYDVILMDIEWAEQKNGIDFASELYRSGNPAKIIYVSAYAERFIEQLFLDESNVVGFLKKPVNMESLKKCLIKVRDQQNKENRNSLKVKENGHQRMISLADILYIESKDHYLDIVTFNKTYHILGTMESFEKKLPEEFVRCHRGFIVNMTYILELKASALILKNNITVPVGRRYRQLLKESYLSYLSGLI